MAVPSFFLYWDRGDLAIVGRSCASGDLRFERFWASVHIYFPIGFANRVIVLLQWAYAFATKRRRGQVLDE